MANLSRFTLTSLDLVTVTHDGRSLQMRLDQLTVNVLSKAFRIIPETLFLVSEQGTIAMPGEGKFQDVDGLMNWIVEGDKTTTGSGTARGASTSASSSKPSKWKPHSFPGTTTTQFRARGAGGSGLSGTVTWTKSIEICYLRGDEVVQVSEHPLNLDESTANVISVQEILSRQAFNGSNVKLLNIKNVPLANVDGTRGARFWKTNKIIRALPESDHIKLERIRSEGASRLSKRYSPLIHVVSDSDSEGDALRSAIKASRRKHRYVPTPPSFSDSDVEPKSKYRATVDVRKLLLEIKDRIPPKEEEADLKATISEIFSCIICKEKFTELSDPVMPPCCRNILACYTCIAQWLETSDTCPHCREDIELVNCVKQPILRPIFEMLK